MSRQWRDGNCNVNIIKEVMCMLLENIQYTTAIEETINVGIQSLCKNARNKAPREGNITINTVFPSPQNDYHPLAPSINTSAVSTLLTHLPKKQEN